MGAPQGKRGAQGIPLGGLGLSGDGRSGALCGRRRPVTVAGGGGGALVEESRGSRAQKHPWDDTKLLGRLIWAMR